MPRLPPQRPRNGLIKIVRGRHTQVFLDELTAFPHGKHDDCVDALASAHTTVTSYGGPATISIPDDIRIDLPSPDRHSWIERHHRETTKASSSQPCSACPYIRRRLPG